MDSYQDQIMTVGVVSGSIITGFMALNADGLSAFKDVMPLVVTITQGASAVYHTILSDRL